LAELVTSPPLPVNREARSWHSALTESLRFLARADDVANVASRCATWLQQMQHRPHHRIR